MDARHRDASELGLNLHTLTSNQQDITMDRELYKRYIRYFVNLCNTLLNFSLHFTRLSRRHFDIVKQEELNFI